MPKPQPSLFSRLLLGNLRNKGTSLIFAVLIWVFAFSNTKHDETIEVRVRIHSSDSKMVVLRTYEADGVTPFSGQVTLVLEGPRNLLNAAIKKSIEGRFRVSETGPLVLEDSENYPELPPGVIVTKSTPRLVVVNLDKLDTQSRPISTRGLTLTPSGRFRALTRDDFVFTPSEVRVTGPESLLDSVQVVVEQQTEVRDWDKETWEETLKLSLDSAAQHRAIRFANGPDQFVNVRVNLKSALATRTFTVPIVYGFSSDPSIEAFRLTGHDKQVDLTCQGTPEALDELAQSITSGAFKIWIPIEDFSGSIDNVESSEFDWPEGALPKGIERRSMSFKPDSILYKVERSREDEENGGG